MKLLTIAASAACVAALASAPSRAQDATVLPLDEPTTINGVEVACTGIGEEAQSDPRWAAYSVRLEFAGGYSQYLADIEATLADANGDAFLHVRCDSPWLLVKLAPGSYRVSGTFEGRLTKTAQFKAPKSGQSRIVVSFPEVLEGQ